MLHMVYPTYDKPLIVGVRLTILNVPLAAGDELAIEYPDNTREGGQVVSCAARDLVIAVGQQQWHLAHIAQTSSPAKFDNRRPTVWEIQAELPA
jgi:hypothetical protein